MLLALSCTSLTPSIMSCGIEQAFEKSLQGTLVGEGSVGRWNNASTSVKWVAEGIKEGHKKWQVASTCVSFVTLGTISSVSSR